LLNCSDKFAPVHSDSIYWSEILAPNRFRMTINNCDSQAFGTGKKSIPFSCLFYMWWCMSCIILRLQQQTWLLKS